MQQYPRPSEGVVEVLDVCNRYVNATLRERFQQAHADFVAVEAEYARAAVEKGLSSVEPRAGLPVSDDEMRRLYQVRLSKRRSSGRTIYDSIKRNSDGMCALCDAQVSTRMDHFLPKEVFPELSFTPINLVPACSWCNEYKGKWHPSDRDGELIHPYFDNIDEQRWLRAHIVDGTPVPRFYVHEPQPGTVSMRLQKHIVRLRLVELFGILANTELAGNRRTFGEQFSEGGKDRLRTFLLQIASSRLEAFGRNSWQMACYVAWAESDWFLSEGFSIAARYNQLAM